MQMNGRPTEGSLWRIRPVRHHADLNGMRKRATISLWARNRSKPIRGRGAGDNPANRFESLAYERDPDAPDDEAPAIRTQFLKDHSKTVLSKNNSPDIPFEYSLNPYRGCEHGCVYCYARPTHEYLGFSAGLDFETRIMVKEDAPALLRRELSKKELAAATDHFVRRHRSVPADRAFAPAHAPLPRSARGAAQPGFDHHQEPARYARDIDLLADLAQGPRGASRDFDYDARQQPCAHARTAHVACRGNASKRSAR
jgi:hypothetical protein